MCPPAWIDAEPDRLRHDPGDCCSPCRRRGPTLRNGPMAPLPRPIIVTGAADQRAGTAGEDHSVHTSGSSSTTTRTCIGVSVLVTRLVSFSGRELFEILHLALQLNHLQLTSD